MYAVSAVGGARNLKLKSLSDSGRPGEICSFIINTHGATGHLEAKLNTPSDRVEAVDILPVDEKDSYCVRFIPIEVVFVDLVLNDIMNFHSSYVLAKNFTIIFFSLMLLYLLKSICLSLLSMNNF